MNSITKKILFFLAILSLGIIGLVIADQIDYKNNRKFSETNPIGKGSESVSNTASIQLTPSRLPTSSQKQIDPNIDGVQSH